MVRWEEEEVTTTVLKDRTDNLIDYRMLLRRIYRLHKDLHLNSNNDRFKRSRSLPINLRELNLRVSLKWSVPLSSQSPLLFFVMLMSTFEELYRVSRQQKLKKMIVASCE